MEGGTYHVDITFTSRLPMTTSEENVVRVTDRLRVWLPPSAKIGGVKANPDTYEVEFFAEFPAESAIDAMQMLRTAMEYLRENIREEHNLDPIGPEPTFKRIIITYLEDEERLPVGSPLRSSDQSS